MPDTSHYTPSLNDALQVQELVRQADQCVACGMCLSSCPTYWLGQQEAESPRGRIALVRAYLEGRLQADQDLFRHLDSCLLCRTCERVCPAKVSFAHLMDAARSRLYPHPKTLGRLQARILELVAHPGRLYTLARLGYWADRMGIRRWLSRTPVLRTITLIRLGSRIPRIKTWPQAKSVAAPQQGKGRVALLAGCVQGIVDDQAVQAALQVLHTAGYGVQVIRQQCCGALHLHAGQLRSAAQLQEELFAEVSEPPVQAVISLSSACAATLQENALPGRPPVYEFCRFIREHISLSALPLRDLRQRVLVHTPCTHRNVLRTESDVTDMLQQIPGLEWQTLDSPVSCCGAAGSHLYDAPEMADTLRSKLLDGITPDAFSALVTSNIGCAMHLGQAPELCGGAGRIALPVWHPAILLQQALERP